MAIAPEVSPPEIIGKDDDDVRTTFVNQGAGTGAPQEGRQKA
jgi:hypothetical protein